MREINLADPVKTVEDVVALVGGSVVKPAVHFVGSVVDTAGDTVVETVKDADTLVDSTLGVDILKREINLEDPVKTVSDVVGLVGDSVAQPAVHFVDSVSDTTKNILTETYKDADTLVSSTLGVDVLRRAIEDPIQTVEAVVNLVGNTVVTPAGHLVESVAKTATGAVTDTVSDADTLVKSVTGVDIL